MCATSIHIGKLIKQVIEAKGIKVSWLAKMLCCSRSNIYKIYAKENIDVELLIRISRLLDHDFFLDISEIMKK